MKAIATSAIHLCRKPGKRDSATREVTSAEIEVIEPGKEFEADDQEVKDLIKAGHARPTGKDEGKPDGKPANK